MGTARLLVLENRLGQRVRTFQVNSDTLNLVYRHDLRRVEASADLSVLDDNNVPYQIVKTLSVGKIPVDGVALPGLGTIRPASAVKVVSTPQYELAKEEDRRDVGIWLKKSAIGHMVAVVMLVGLSFLTAYLNQKEEPALVTIVVPPKAEKTAQNVPTIKPAAEKVKPITRKARVAEKTVQPKRAAKVTTKTTRPSTTNTRRVVHTDRPRDLNRVGALAALGGLRNGHRGAEGLDLNSVKNIRSAGVGSGGGGVGNAGKGGMTGVLPGKGLIAGSSGQGGRAESAGGYGTKGVGGGRAGYGKISLVGNIGGISLPLEEEATVAGGLDRDQIAAVINRNRGQIVYCYEQGLQNHPQLTGRVTVDFVIGASGRITKASIAQSSLGSKAVETCMLARMRGWQFPRPVGKVNVDVLYPFELRRVSSR